MKRRQLLESIAAASTVPFIPDIGYSTDEEGEEWEWIEERELWRGRDHEVYLRGMNDEILIYRPIVYGFPYLEGEKVIVRNQQKDEGLYKIEPWAAEADGPPAPKFEEHYVIKYIEEEGQKKTIFYNFYYEKYTVDGWVKQ